MLGGAAAFGRLARARSRRARYRRIGYPAIRHRRRSTPTNISTPYAQRSAGARLHRGSEPHHRLSRRPTASNEGLSDAGIRTGPSQGRRHRDARDASSSWRPRTPAHYHPSGHGGERTIRSCTGIVASLARPGGNVTGLSALVSVAGTAKQFELLKDLAAQGSPRVAALYNMGSPSRPPPVRDTLKQATAVRSAIAPQLVVACASPDDLEHAFDAALPRSVPMRSSSRTTRSLLTSRRDQVADARGDAHALPTIYRVSASSSTAGGLMTLWRRASPISIATSGDLTSAGSSRAPSRPTCRWSSRPSSSW